MRANEQAHRDSTTGLGADDKVGLLQAHAEWLGQPPVDPDVGADSLPGFGVDVLLGPSLRGVGHEGKPDDGAVVGHVDVNRTVAAGHWLTAFRETSAAW